MIMKMNNYRGRGLRLSYPELLTVESREPEWYAVAKDRGSSVAISIRPGGSLDEGILEEFQVQPQSGFVGLTVIRIGPFVSPTGLHGFERLKRLSDATGKIKSWEWFVAGVGGGNLVVEASLFVSDRDWRDGILWAELLNSIEVLPEVGETRLKDPVPSVGVRRLASQSKSQVIGVLSQLPSDLRYLADVALAFQSLPSERPGEDPEKRYKTITKFLEMQLEAEMRELPPERARAKLISDRRRLLEWLKDYPSETYPEAEGLFALCGVLPQAKAVFRNRG
jgi:hypothetical protein